ncbi:alkaline phosphatase family protein [Halothermothrix orenii]|uniref:Type I phosphodiesterase/nucleotide pyrophosphatase n=1 Tax=Halothermothrix orenii (strain H 168 / OCM 544 / DSM 9562) TaxID=373903 RepID=B8CYV7_HALOH|nr:alkaline phosphatase family protein [Halothermothrix orenii]ACL70476.1 type I phosphodiesterase/nucleotide pyrophosphatase [Halothermothrix orenii H 168]
MSGRVLVIGIDGGEFSLIRKWIRQGKLPNLEKITKKGSYGYLTSTIPPITGAAWSSFQTGTNPGKHGAFNWFKRVKNAYKATPVNATDIAEPTLWEIISKFDKKVGVIGVPVTYPPGKVNGYIIPGLLTPSKSKKQSYPADFIKEVRKIVPDFKFSPKEWTRGYMPRKWVKEMIEDVANKTKLTAHLMKEKAWDFMMVHFMETDQVQHFMWHHFEKKEKTWNPVLKIYQAVDRAIGTLKESLDSDDTLYIMSDHGFGPLRYNFHIDTWLLKEGYIKLKKNIPTALKKFLFNLGFTKETFYPVGEFLYPVLRKYGLLETVLDLVGNPWLERLFLSSHNVDWKSTKAYSHSEIGHIYLNIKGREPRGMLEPEEAEEEREKIIEKLKNLKNPFTGKKITSKVFRGEELYHGSKVNGAPDIVFLPDDMEILGKGAYEFLSHHVVSKSRSQSGHHRLKGVLFGIGPGIKKGYEVRDAHIMDMAPTILYQMGLPIMDYMDGKVLNSMFEEKYLEENEKQYTTKSSLGIEDREALDEEEEEEMKKRLKGLGYVS